MHDTTFSSARSRGKCLLKRGGNKRNSARLAGQPTDERPPSRWTGGPSWKEGGYHPIATHFSLPGNLVPNTRSWGPHSRLLFGLSRLEPTPQSNAVVFKKKLRQSHSTLHKLILYHSIISSLDKLRYLSPRDGEKASLQLRETSMENESLVRAFAA